MKTRLKILALLSFESFLGRTKNLHIEVDGAHLKMSKIWKICLELYMARAIHVSISISRLKLKDELCS